MDPFEQYLLQRIINVQEMKNASDFRKVIREPQMLQLLQDVLELVLENYYDLNN